jgi:hypothetical protein
MADAEADIPDAASGLTGDDDRLDVTLVLRPPELAVTFH